MRQVRGDGKLPHDEKPIYAACGIVLRPLYSNLSYDRVYARLQFT